MPIAGTQTIAARDSMTDSKNGMRATSRHGPGSVLSVPGSGMFWRAVKPSARTRGWSRRRTTRTTVRTTSGQPKNPFSSVRLSDSEAATCSSPARERVANSRSAIGLLPTMPCSTLW